MKRFITAAALTALTFALSSCSAFLRSPIPGVRNKVTTRMPHGLEYSRAMLAIKVAIGEAITQVRAMQRADTLAREKRGWGPHPASTLEFQPSNATLTTTVQTDVTDGGGVSMIIPFSGLPGTLASPGLLAGRAASTKQVKKLNFTLIPKTIKAPDAATLSQLKGIRIDNGVVEALCADFQAFLDITTDAGINVQPRTLTYNFALLVKRSGSGGVTLSIVPTTPSIKNIGVGNLGSSRTDTTTSELEIALSVGYPNPTAGAQPATLFYEEYGTKGSAWVQVPYTEDELKKVIGEKRGLGPKPGSVISIQDLRQLLEAAKKPLPPAEGSQPQVNPPQKSLGIPSTPLIQPKLRTTRPLLKDPAGF